MYGEEEQGLGSSRFQVGGVCCKESLYFVAQNH